MSILALLFDYELQLGYSFRVLVADGVLCRSSFRPTVTERRRLPASVTLGSGWFLRSLWLQANVFSFVLPNLQFGNSKQTRVCNSHCRIATKIGTCKNWYFFSNRNSCVPSVASERFFQRWELQIPFFFSQPNLEIRLNGRTFWLQANKFERQIRLNISIASDHRTSAGITYFQLTHNLYRTNLSSCYPLATLLLPPYYRLTSLHHNYPSPNLAIPYI